MRRGFRIGKLSTTADVWDCRADSVTTIMSCDLGLPRDSWWTVPRTWHEFTEAARVAQERMEISRFGRTHGDNVL